MKKTSLIISLLLVVIVINIVVAILPYSDKYFKGDYWRRYPALKKKYYDSIYANKKGDFIRDEYVYSFAAGSLIKGVSPILVNPETPPLGKYFTAVSILLFKNEHLLTLLFGIGSLVLLFIVGRQVFSSTILSLLPVALLSFEPLFLNQLIITPLLDIIQVCFLLSFFYFFNKAESTKKYILFYVLASCMVGGFISTKFFGTGVTLVGAAGVVLLMRRQIQNLIRFSVTLILAPMILLVNYIQVLFSGYSVSAFLGIQKWILLYNQGHLTKLFTFFPLFLFNIWYSWWDTSIMSDSQWRITWPLSFLMLILVLFYYLKYKKYRNKALDIVLTWTVIYIVLLQAGYTSARYFVLLLPPIFLIMTYGFKVTLLEYRRRKK